MVFTTAVLYYGANIPNESTHIFNEFMERRPLYMSNVLSSSRIYTEEQEVITIR